MTAPTTPLQVVQRLTQLTGELRTLVESYAVAELDAVVKDHDADVAEARAYLLAEGTAPARTADAKVKTDRMRGEAEVALSLVRVLKARLRAVETQIEVGRTFSATVRSELKTLGYESGTTT